MQHANRMSKQILKFHFADSRFDDRFLFSKKNHDKSFDDIFWFSQPGFKLGKGFESFMVDSLDGVLSDYGNPSGCLNIRISAGINNFTHKVYEQDMGYYIYNDMSVQEFVGAAVDLKHNILLRFPNAIVTYSTIPTVCLETYNLCQVDEKLFGHTCCNIHLRKFQKKFYSDNINLHKFLMAKIKNNVFKEQQKTLNHLLHQVNIEINTLNCKQQPLVPSGTTICPLADITSNSHTKRSGKKHKNSKSVFTISVKENLYRDGLHFTGCTQLKAAKEIVKSFENDALKINYLDKNITNDVPGNLLKNLVISNSPTGLSQITIDYSFYNEGVGNDFFNKLVGNIKWEKRPQRFIKWYGPVPYKYGHHKHEIDNNWCEELVTIKKHLEERLNAKVNSVLVNYYESPNHHVNYHQDNEPIFGDSPVIYSVSFGGKRNFILAPKNKQESTRHKLNIQLTSGSLLIMMGQTQVDWFHAVLPPYEKDPAKIVPRINCTFRLCR